MYVNRVIISILIYMIFFCLFILIVFFFLQSIMICEKSETTDGGIYHIYRRNLYELKCVQNSGSRSNNQNVKLKNTADKTSNSVPLSIKNLDSEDDVKYNGVINKNKYNNINYNGLSKQLTL